MKNESLPLDIIPWDSEPKNEEEEELAKITDGDKFPWPDDGVDYSVDGYASSIMWKRTPFLFMKACQLRHRRRNPTLPEKGGLTTAEPDDEERFPEFSNLERCPGVDYSIHQPSDEKVKRLHPEVWKYNCEHDPVRNPSLRREYEEKRFPEFAKLEKVPGVDYSVKQMWDGKVKRWNPEGWKLNCEANPDRNPHLGDEGSGSGHETKRLRGR